MHKLFTLEEIKIAAYNAMARMADDPDILKMFYGMEELISDLADQMKEPEEPVAAPEPVKADPEKKPQPEGKNRNGPCKVVQPGKFFGPAAAMKREVWEKMMNLKTMEGKTITEISEMTKGKVTPDEIRAMCGTKKVPLAKWEILADALGVER